MSVKKVCINYIYCDDQLDNSAANLTTHKASVEKADHNDYCVSYASVANAMIINRCDWHYDIMHFLPGLLLTASHTDPITGMTGLVSDDPANGYISPKDVYCGWLTVSPHHSPNTGL